MESNRQQTEEVMMPLPKGKKNIGRNIRELEGTGRSYNQSLAIALRVAGVKPKKQH
jgi:hypothetical protein